MSEAQFYSFFAGGVAIIIALLVLVAWNLLRMREYTRAGRDSALEGVAHEMRINLKRMVSELSQVAANPGAGPDVLLPIRHPQLDGVNGALIPANREGIAMVGSAYQELEARKLALRACLAQGKPPGIVLDDAMEAAINGIATLYIWEVHEGARPSSVGSVRSWAVRDWMKGHGFKADSFPGMHLRDEVVERLRIYGLALTPRPLTHTAHEYYSMRYDRYADMRGPMGMRQVKKEREGVTIGRSQRLSKLLSFGRRPAQAEPAIETAETETGTLQTVAAPAEPARTREPVPEPAGDPSKPVN
jgi:hypothetical protein